MTFALSNRAFVIAEAGTCHAHVTHRNRLKAAYRYVDAAARAGADAIKFQMFNLPIRDDFFCWIDGDEVRSLRWEQSVMEFDRWSLVKAYAESMGLVFLASAFQHSTVGWLKDLNVSAYKVASRAAKGFPYKDATGPFLVSNGMHPVPDGVIGIQCEANYPSTAYWTGVLPGFSDHSGNPWRAVDAIARGCKLIEVHFAIDPAEAGPDLPASLTCDQLKWVCEARDFFTRKETE